MLCGGTHALFPVLVIRFSLAQDFNYGFASNGSVTSIINNRDNTRSQTFTYDALNRIATAAASTHAQSSANCWGESFSIDAYGNLTSISAISSAYNNCTQDSLSVAVSSSTNQFTTSGYCYDAAGNLLGQSYCSTYAYDAENELISTGGVTYTYDGDGKRVKSDQTSGSTYDRLYWYDLGLDPLAESDLSGTVTDEYVFFSGQRIARRIVSGSAVKYYVSDHLGSSRVVTDSSGGILDDCDYFPYGGLTSSCSSSSGNRYKFTGKERDTESSLDYSMARHYSSWMGRFMSPDEPFANQNPSDPQSWNLYSYARNNPLNLIDPSGRYTECLSVTTEAFDTGFDGDLKVTVNTTETCTWYPDQTEDDVTRMQTAYYQQQIDARASLTRPTTDQPQTPSPNNLVPANPCAYTGRALTAYDYASSGKSSSLFSHPINFALDVIKGFPTGDYLDPQPLASGNVLQNAAYGNYAFGVYMAAAHVPLSIAVTGAAVFGLHHTYTSANGPRDPIFRNLPAANVANITNGFNAEKSGTLCHE